MVVVADVVLSFTAGTLGSSQSSRVAGLCLALRRICYVGHIEGSCMYCVLTWSMRRRC